VQYSVITKDSECARHFAPCAVARRRSRHPRRLVVADGYKARVRKVAESEFKGRK